MIRFYNLFKVSIKKKDSDIKKKRIEIINKYIAIFLIMFLGLSFAALNKSKTFFIIHLLIFFFLLINIFIRIKLNALVYSLFICFLLTLVFFHLHNYGLFLGTGIYFIAILTSLPIFLSWKTQKIYFYIVLAFASIVFVTGYFLKLNLKSSLPVMDEASIKSNIYNTLFGSLSIIINIYFIRKMNKEIEIAENKESGIILQSEALMHLIKTNNPLYINEFKRSYPLFAKNLHIRHPNISQNEFKFCSLLLMELSSKEIAGYLNLEYRTIQTKKNKLRRKLELEAHTDLYVYMKSLEN